MSLNKARNPHTIFQKIIRDNINDRKEHTLGRAIVYEVDTIGGKWNNNPPNTIKARIFKPQIDTDGSGYTILWPLEDFISRPIFPFEQVLCIFESEDDFGYWIARIPNINKSYISAENDLITNRQDTSAAQAFGVEDNNQSGVSINDITRSEENFDEQIRDFADNFNKIVEFDKRYQDTYISCKNTARVVIGNDRIDSKDSGNKDGEAIDMVVGVQEDNGDPNFEDDGARCYISSKSSYKDKNRPLFYVRADDHEIIARKEVNIESSDGNIQIQLKDNKVYIKSNNIVCDGMTNIGGQIGKNILIVNPETTKTFNSIIQGLSSSINGIAAGLAPTPAAPVAPGLVAIVESLKQIVGLIEESSNSQAK